MIVLSLFDGMSCGRLALERAGIFVTRYFASEIDKHAIKVSKAKWPDIIHIGNVEKVRYKDGILYTENGNFPIKRIDMLIGGSPCQGFSFAGDMLAFNDPRSKLFFEYERILKEIKSENPEIIFFLENVTMKIEHERVINERLGLYPVEYDSSLVSAQNRIRLYWTNILHVTFGFFNEVTSGVAPPSDKGIVLQDILQEKVHRKYYLTKKALKRIFKNKNFVPKINPEKTGTLLTKNNSGQLSRDNGTTLIGVINDEGILKQRDKANCLDSNSYKGIDNHRQRTAIMQLPRGKNEGGIHNDKSPTLTSNSWQQNNVLTDSIKLRRLTPIECCRLQNVPDDYFFENGKQIVSDTQIYKMLGNGWTIDMIAWFFKHI